MDVCVYENKNFPLTLLDFRLPVPSVFLNLNYSRYLVVCGSYLLCTYLSTVTSFKANYSLIPAWELRMKISQNDCCKSVLV